MTHYNCQLTVSLPAALEEDALDLLQAHPEWISGFSVIQAEGFGSGSMLRSALEQVRGRARRVLIQVLIDDAHREAIIELLRAQYASDEIAWWTSPVTAFGRLG